MHRNKSDDRGQDAWQGQATTATYIFTTIISKRDKLTLSSTSVCQIREDSWFIQSREHLGALPQDPPKNRVKSLPSVTETKVVHPIHSNPRLPPSSPYARRPDVRSHKWHPKSNQPYIMYSRIFEEYQCLQGIDYARCKAWTCMAWPQLRGGYEPYYTDLPE